MTGQTHETSFLMDEATPPQPRPTRRRAAMRSRSGFSLVEVLVAIAVLTIGIIAFLEIFPGGILSLQVAANISAADRIAQEQLNELSPGNGAEIQQIAAVESIYSDSDVGTNTSVVQLDPNFNLSQAISPASGLNTVYNASTPNASLSTGYNVAVSTTGANILNPEPYEYVSGERVTIPSPTAASTLYENTGTPATGNIMLDFGPITMPAVGGTAYNYPDLDKYNSLDPNVHCSFFVHGLPWKSQPGSSGTLTSSVLPGGATPTSVAGDDPESELKLNSPAYLIDYSHCAIALRNPIPLNSDGTPGQNAYDQTFIFQVGVLSAGSTAPLTRTFIFNADWPGATATGTTNPLEFYDTTNHSRWVSFQATTNPDGTASTEPQYLGGTTALQPGDTFVPGTEKLVRDFKKVNTFDNDPYEFGVESSAVITTDSSNNISEIGELSFNPLASAIMDTRGQPLQASVDYIVQDWRTLHEDRTIGDQASTNQGEVASTTVRMTLKNLLKYGARDTNNALFNGIANAGSNKDVLVYDLDTFQPLMEVTSATSSSRNEFTVDYANAAVTIYGVPTGEHVRVYYRAEDSWGVSVVKPAATYTVVSAVNGADSPATTGQAVLDVNTAANTAKLSFRPCDIGQSVQIGGTLSYTASGATTTVPLSLLTTLSAAPGTQAAAPGVVDLTQAISGGLPTGAVINVLDTTPTASGASITAHASWLQQRAVWRSRDVTTIDLPTAS